MASDHDITQALIEHSLPCAWLDQERLEHNIHQLEKMAKPLKIRIASKSVRCRSLLEYLLNKYSNIFHGILAYHPDEAMWLINHGIKDVLVGYPYIRWFAAKHDKNQNWDQVTFMVDRIEHMEAVNKLANYLERDINICFDIDLSTKHFGVHFGVYRSAKTRGRNV